MSSDFVPCNYCGQTDEKSANFCRFCGKPKHDKLKKKFDCPHCRNRINNYSDYCQYCGTKISKEIRNVYNYSQKKKCTKCNTMNDIDANNCSNCGKELPVVTEVHYIDCPGCNNKIFDDSNYCRYCGYNFVEYKSQSNGGLGLFAKKLKSSASNLIGDLHCSNCNHTHGGNPKYCNKCGSEIISDVNYLNSKLSIEEYRLKLINQILVPLSKYYNVNFRITAISDYFNISKEEELHIIYVLMEEIEKYDSIDIVKLFDSTLNKTKNDFKNLEETILNSIKEDLTNMFNSKGISASDVFTIKSGQYDTIETPIVENKHGTLTKGAATLGFGLIGLAATSGVKTTTETKKIFRSGEYTHFRITFNNRGIALNSYNSESASKSFDSKRGNINQTTIQYEDISSFNIRDFTFLLKSGENFKCPEFELKSIVRKNIYKFVKSYDGEVTYQFVKKYLDKLNDKANVFVGELINEQVTLAKSNKSNIPQKNNVDIDGLEKIVNMYEKGLLTEEEFINLKQGIIGNNSNTNKIIKESETETDTNNEININYEEFTPKMIRETFSYINEQFREEGKIVGVEEILDKAGVDYIIIKKNNLYGLNPKDL